MLILCLTVLRSHRLPYHLPSSSLTLELQVFCLPLAICVQFTVVYFSDKSGRPIEQDVTVATGCSSFSVSLVAMCLVWRNVCSSALLIFKIVLLGFVIGFGNFLFDSYRIYELQTFSPIL